MGKYYYEKLMGTPMHFPYDEVYHRTGIGWEKTTHTMGKVWLPISQVLPIRWVLLHFPRLWKIDGKTQAFPISWNSLIFSCVPLNNFILTTLNLVQFLKLLLSSNLINSSFFRCWRVCCLNVRQPQMNQKTFAIL